MKEFKILHLSDAHIGHPDWSTDFKAVMSPLLSDISLLSENSPPDLIIFSGDLIYGEVRGAKIPDQLTQAGAWLTALHTCWNLKVGDVPMVFCPGNHDLQRSLTDEMQKDWLRSQTSDDAISKAIAQNTIQWTRIKERHSLWWKFLQNIPVKELERDDSFHLSSAVFDFDGKTIGVVAYDSSWSCCGKDDKGKLWLTLQQFQRGHDKIKGCDLRIAVIHHPLSWFHEYEEQWLGLRFQTSFHLLLHGHIHTSWYTPAENHLCISAGACWAGAKCRNAYSWITIGADLNSIELHCRTYYNEVGKWGAAELPGQYDKGIARLQLRRTISDAEEEQEVIAITSTEDPITSTTEISITYPFAREDWLPRDEQLDLLLENFEGANLILQLGQEGVGKTVFLALLAQRFPTTTIQLFVTPGSRWSTALQMARYELCNQAQWIATKQQIEIGTPVNDGMLSSALMRLQRWSRNQRKRILILVDGVSKAVTTDVKEAFREIFELFDTHFNAFHFVVTATPEMLPEIARNLNYRTYTLPRFSRSETILFLGGTVSEAKKNEIWSMTRGHPSALASIKRILTRTPDLPINSLSASLPELFKHEWAQVDEKNEQQLLLLAACALFPERFTVDHLSNGLKVSQSSIDAAVTDLGFLSYIDNGQRIVFLSPEFREFVAKKLKRFEQIVRDVLVAELMRDPSSSTALSEVPLYLSESQKDSELLAYLTPDHLSKLLQQSQSWHDTLAKTELAFNAALKIENFQESSRFALHRAALLEYQRITSNRLAVDALLSLGKISEALAYADTKVIKTERLLLLSIIAKFARQNKLITPASLGESIEKLACDLPPGTSSEQAIEIASELIHCYPDLAIRVIEFLSDSQENIDSVLMKLSIDALLKEKTDPLQEDDSVEAIKAKFGSDKVRMFSAVTEAIFGSRSTTEALASIKAISSPRDQIYLLRHWTSAHESSEDAFPVLEYALDLMVKTTEYVPNALALRQLAAPLPSLEKNYAVVGLVTRFSEQVKLLKGAGFTEDYVHLQMILAETEARYREPGYKTRLEDSFFFVSAVEDRSVRMSCMALMYTLIDRFEGDDHLAVASTLKSTIGDELDGLYQEMLDCSADHYRSARSGLRHLQMSDTKRAFDFAALLNSEPRRNQMYADLFEAEWQKDQPSLDNLVKLFEAIANRDLRESQMLGLLKAVSHIAPVRIVQLLVQFVSAAVMQFQDMFRRSYGISLLLSALEKLPSYPENLSQETLLAELNKSWNSIDDLSVKRDCGLRIVVNISKILPGKAEELWRDVESISSRAKVNEFGSFSILYHNILLAIRLFRGLIPRNVATDRELNAIVSQIEQLPSASKRAMLFGELALSYYRHNRESQGSRVVQSHLSGVLEQIALRDRSLYERTFVIVAPAVYCSNASNAFLKLRGFEPSNRDAAMERICSFLQYRVPPGDPYTVEEKQDLHLKFDDLANIAALLDKAENDALICWTIEKIVESVKGEIRITAQQQTELTSQLRSTIATRLPSSRFIQHDGYAIVALAQLTRLTGSKVSELQELVGRARGIPNVADRAFVLALIATTYPSSRLSAAKDLMAESLEVASGILVHEDRVERYRGLAKLAKHIDKSLAKEAINRAAACVGLVEDWRVTVHAREVIDSAYKVDEELAEELAVKLDNDAARTRLKRGGSHRRLEQDLRQKLRNGESFLELGREALERVDDVVWDTWADVNAGKVRRLKYSECLPLFSYAATIPIERAFKTWMFLAENLTGQYEFTAQAETIIKGFFESVLVNGELTMLIARTEFSDLGASAKERFEEFHTGVTFIPIGSRYRALNEITQWCVETVDDYILVVDPSFTEVDLSLIEALLEVRPDSQVIVLASKGIQSPKAGTNSIEDSYKRTWREMTLGNTSGSVEVILVGSGLTGDLPVEERAILSGRGGLVMDTSFSQIGISKAARLKRIDGEEAARLVTSVEPYWQTKLGKSADSSVSISRFTLA